MEQIGRQEPGGTNLTGDVMGGRPRKPTALKRLQGTLQKCRTPKAEPQPEHELKNLLPPDYLTESAKQVWSYALDQAPAGMLTTLDFAVFSRWVVLFDQFMTLSSAIKKEGTIQENEDGSLAVNPMLRALNQTATTLRALETELGFTPASRSKVVSLKNPTGPANAFEGL